MTTLSLTQSPYYSYVDNDRCLIHDIKIPYTQYEKSQLKQKIESGKFTGIRIVNHYGYVVVQNIQHKRIFKSLVKVAINDMIRWVPNCIHIIINGDEINFMPIIHKIVDDYDFIKINVTNRLIEGHYVIMGFKVSPLFTATHNYATYDCKNQPTPLFQASWSTQASNEKIKDCFTPDDDKDIVNSIAECKIINPILSCEIKKCNCGEPAVCVVVDPSKYYCYRCLANLSHSELQGTFGCCDIHARMHNFWCNNCSLLSTMIAKLKKHHCSGS